jgi:hypothetical protein
MKTTIPALILTAMASAALAAAHSHGKGGKTVSVTGELVDMACFMAHEGRGAKHAKCAEQCVLGGAPLGLATKEGKVWLLIEDHSSAKTRKPYLEAKKLVSKTAAITGEAYERGGLSAIAVSGVEAVR